jgi:uncharacterized protein (TIGR03083 family)
MSETTPIQVSGIPRVTHREWMSIAREQNAALLSLLRDLQEPEWSTPTECEGWDVKDMVAHTLAWAEVMTAPGKYAKQTVVGVRNKKSFGGSSLDATNDFQVRSRRHLTPDEFINLLDKHLRRQNKFLTGAGVALRYVPFKEPFAGHWVNLGYVADRIMTRDHFMHRLDICRATGRDPNGPPSDGTIVSDVVKEWTTRSGASVTLHLAGPAGGTYVCGTGASGEIRGDAFDLMRRLAGRRGDFEIDGDERAIEAWLGVLCTF